MKMHLYNNINLDCVSWSYVTTLLNKSKTHSIAITCGGGGVDNEVSQLHAMLFEPLDYM